MAAKQQKIQQVTVTCEVCKKQVLPEGGLAIPVKYVVYNGHNVCQQCMHEGKTNQFRQI